ncbi:MAG: ATP-binding protein [Bdellovibrionota bacterium]
MNFHAEPDKNPLKKVCRFLLIPLLLAVAILAWFSYEEDRIFEYFVDNLNKIALSMNESIEKIWAKRNFDVAESIVDLPDFKRLADEIIKSKSSNIKAQEKLKRLFSSRVLESEFEGFLLTDLNFLVRASYIPYSLNKHVQFRELFPEKIKRLEQGFSIVIPPITSEIPLRDQFGILKHKRPTMFVGIAAMDTHNQKIGYFFLRINPFGSFSKLVKIGQVGRTVDTYVVDKRGVLLSESRFVESLREKGILSISGSSLLNIQQTVPGEGNEKTELYKAVLKEKSALLVDPYPDYRGVRVLGALHWSPTLELGFVAEIDEDEIKEYYRKSAYFAAILYTLIIIILFGSYMVIRINHIRSLEKIKLSEKLTYDIINSNVMGILLFHEDGRIEMFSAEALKLFEYSESEIIGHNVSILFPDDQVIADAKEEISDPFLAIRSLVGKGTHEYIGIKKNGDPFQIKIGLDEIQSKNERLFVAFIEDNEAAIIAREQLEEKNKQLAVAKQTAEQLSQHKSDFLANVSHEIRTPLHGVIGMLHLALKTELCEDKESYLQKSYASAQLLLRVINDILDLSKVEAGKIEIAKEDFYLDRVIEDIYNVCNVSAKDKGLALYLSVDSKNIPRVLIGDSFRLTQILLNLLSNAIKFTSSGYVRLKVNMLDLDEEDKIVRLMFRVIDTGIGISKQNISRVFESFQQENLSTTKEYGGTGLGLSISKNLTELMGGRIFVESSPGKGSEFGVVLDFGFQSCADLSAKDLEMISAPTFNDLSGKKILLAEDNEINQEVMLHMLRDINMQVDLAIDGEVAIAKVDKANYDFILIDIHMPKIDGIEAVRDIRTKPSYCLTPIIALTANVLTEDKKKYFETGIDAILEKPTDLMQLESTLLECLGKLNGDIPTLIVEKFGSSAQRVLSRFGDDWAVYVRFSEKFLNKCVSEIKRIETLLDEGKFEEIKEILHSIAGVCLNLGMVNFSRILEHAYHTWNENCERVDVEYKNLMQALTYQEILIYKLIDTLQKKKIT